MFDRIAFAALALAAFLPAPAAAQELPEGQSEADFGAWLDAVPGRRAMVLSFEAWQQAAGADHILPSWQVTRTASMWRVCNGQPFEIAPPNLWPGMAHTLKYIRDHVVHALGPVEAVSGYRNPALNACAHGAPGSAHQGYFALDLIPLTPIQRPELMRRLCAMHAASGQEARVGLGFYAFVRFHIDTNGFRRWGAAGPNHNESPCAVIERGEDPDAVYPPVAPATATPAATPAPAPSSTPQ